MPVVQIPFLCVVPMEKTEAKPFRPVVQLYMSRDGMVFGEHIGDEVLTYRDATGNKNKMILLGSYYGQGLDDFFYNGKLTPNLDAWMRNSRQKLETSANYWFGVIDARMAKIAYRKSRVEEKARRKQLARKAISGT